VAEGDYVILHGRFTGEGRPAARIVAEVVRIEDDRNETENLRIGQANRAPWTKMAILLISMSFQSSILSHNRELSDGPRVPTFWKC
jgi:hypothetical protein